MIIAGPGDLFSTVLPVLIVPQITAELKKSKGMKVFIINIANKPFETKGFKVSDYIKTLQAHLGGLVFDTILINTNQKNEIPPNLNYQYVKNDREKLQNLQARLYEGDFVSNQFPIYHDSTKVAHFIKNLTAK